MLRPFLSVAASWVPPRRINLGYPLSHFGKQYRARFCDDVPGDVLKWAVERALVGGHSDILDMMFPIDDGSALYRILMPCGPVFPVIRNGTAVTVFSAKEVRNHRGGRRLRKAHTGRRARQTAPEFRGFR